MEGMDGWLGKERFIQTARLFNIDVKDENDGMLVYTGTKSLPVSQMYRRAPFHL